MYLESAGRGRFCLRRRIVAAAHVGSCSSSVSRFRRLKEEEEDNREGGAAGLLAGGFFVTGAVEVEGDGSKPVNKDERVITERFREHYDIFSKGFDMVDFWLFVITSG